MPNLDDWDAPTPEYTSRKTRPNRIHVASNGVAIEFEGERKKPQVEEQKPAKTLEFPATEAEFSTAIAPYKGCRYWVAGKHASKDNPAEYHYFVERDGKTTNSDSSFASVYQAGVAAREAICKS